MEDLSFLDVLVIFVFVWTFFGWISALAISLEYDALNNKQVAFMCFVAGPIISILVAIIAAGCYVVTSVMDYLGDES